MVAFACSVGRGKGLRKTGLTPPAVPGAATALAKAGVGGLNNKKYIYITIKIICLIIVLIYELYYIIYPPPLILEYLGGDKPRNF